VIGGAASVGLNQLVVNRLPAIIIISTGDELVDVHEQPTPYQVRRSNGYTLQAALRPYGIAAAMVHVPDIESVIKTEIKRCLDTYDVLLLSGGISMGKYDLVPKVLEELGVEKLFHKVQQRPGKPFWFGALPGGSKVFAFPGNPVSAFMCLHRYFIPWLKACSGGSSEKLYAMLDNDLVFEPPLQYFLQVKLYINEAAQLMARPLQGNGSGDFSNLVETDAFMELPLEQSNFKQGTPYPVWPYKSIFI
jgi:molybdopterin molybdotransferase